MLPLLGENVPEEEIDALFALADQDGSGLIEYDEFKLLMRGHFPTLHRSPRLALTTAA